MDTNLHRPILFNPSGCLSEQVIEAYVSHALSAPQQQEVDTHLQTCALCRDAVEGYLLNPVAVPDFNAMIDRKIQGNQQEDRLTNRRMNRITTVLAIAATLILFLGIYWIIIDQIPQQKQEVAMMEMAPVPDSLSPPVPVPLPPPENTTRVKDPAMFMVPDVVTDSVVVAENYTRDEVSMASDEEATLPVQEDKSGNHIHAAKEQMEEKATLRTGVSAKRKATGKAEVVEDKPVYAMVEEMPEYPGGEEARLRFLAENLTYPQVAKESGIEGTVYLTMVIDETGSLKDVRVIRGIGGGCDEEAVRVIKKMPRWKPATQAGKPVSVKYTLPVRFKLN